MVRLRLLRHAVSQRQDNARVALVEKQQTKLLLVGERHAGAALADHVLP